MRLQPSVKPVAEQKNKKGNRPIIESHPAIRENAFFADEAFSVALDYKEKWIELERILGTFRHAGKSPHHRRHPEDYLQDNADDLNCISHKYIHCRCNKYNSLCKNDHICKII